MLKARVIVFVSVAMCIALTAGCAPRLQEFGAVDTEMQLLDDAAIMADGARLPVKVWHARRPRAIVLGVHGMNDYSNAFAMPAPWLAKHGVTTYAYDQRGFGETDQRGVWPGADIMASDLTAVVSLLRTKHPQLPLYIIGVSMGGGVTMKALASGLEVDGAVLVAPAIWGWQAMNPLYKSALWVSAHTMPWKTATGSGLEIRPSDNIEMLRAFSKDPLVIKETRIDAVYGVVNLMDDAYSAASGLNTPVLYLYGEKDEIVPADPTYKVMAKITAQKRLVVYENGWHMLLRDKQRERVWRDILTWIKDRDAPLPSGEEFKPEDNIAQAKQ